MKTESGMLWRFATSVVLTMAGVLSACSPAEPAVTDGPPRDTVEIVFAGFTAGGSMQMRADAMAEAVRLEHPEWRVTSFAPGGEARLQKTRILGEADFYLPPVFRPLEIEVHAPLYPDIDFEQATDYRIVMPSSYVYVHMFALERTGLTDIADIVNQQYLFTMGSGVGIVRLLFDKMLGYYGSSIAETEAWGARYETAPMTSAEGIDALESGRVDVGFTYASVPHPTYMGIDFGVRMLGISEPGLLKMLEQYGCSPAVIPAGTYSFLSSDVPTVRSQESLATRHDMPDDIVYEVCRAIFEHLDILVAAHPSSGLQLTPEGVASAVALAEKLGQSYHPGALKYFRDKGWLN